MSTSTKRKTRDSIPSEFYHLFVNSPIDGALYRKVLKTVTSGSRPKCAVLSLITYGGSPHDAYRIGRFLQARFQELYIHVPTVCASAGTLLVCSGSGLIISPMSELGPLDAQLLKSDEIRTRRSGLVTRSLFENLGAHAFELHTSLVENIIAHSGGTIKYRTAAHVAGEMVVGLMHGLYEQMNPEQIGEDYRFLKVAEEYGKRLADKHQNISEENLTALVYDFPSHDFIIDFVEAIKIFESVDLPSTELQGAISDENKTPLSPLGGKDRVVTGDVVNGCPIYDRSGATGEKNDAGKASVASDGDGQDAPRGNGTDKSITNGQDADRNSRGGKQKPATSPAPQAQK